MTNYKRYILGSAMAMFAMTNLHAQTYNDTVRTNTWSVFAQGGVSYFWKMRGGTFDNAKKRVSPDAAVGVKYNIRPWVRVGLKFEYTQIKAVNEGSLLISEQKDIATTLNGKPAVQRTTIERIQNMNLMHVGMADLNVDFNIMDIWHNRRSQKFNLWIGTGAGYLRGWNRDQMAFSICSDIVAEGDTYYNVQSNDQIQSYGDNTHVDALYIPLSLSAEWDVTPRWTLGVYAEGKYLPLNKDLTPKFMAMAGAKVAYNFVGKKKKTNKQLYYEALAQADALRECCNESQAAKAKLEAANKKAAELQNKLDDANKRNADQQNQPKAINDQNGHVVYFPLNNSNISEQEQLRLDQYIAQVKQNGKKLTVVGEASSDGNTDYNQNLSQSRLNTVLNYLKSKGIDNAHIGSTKAIGASQSEAKSLFRRVVITEE